MCFDPTVTWLLIVTEDATIFIIPARSILVRELLNKQLIRIFQPEPEFSSHLINEDVMLFKVQREIPIIYLIL